MVDVCGSEHDAGSLLLRIDPIAFRTAYNDHTACEEVWICGECGEEYDDEEDAEECCQEGEK